MTAPTTFAIDDVVRIVAIALERYAADAGSRPAHEPRVYSIDEVAKMTGIGKRRILDGCRSGEFPHVNQSGPEKAEKASRGMTVDQIADLVSRCTEDNRVTVPDDDMSAARVSSRRASARRAPRRVA